MKLTITTTLIATALMLASTSAFAEKNKDLARFNDMDINKDKQVTLEESTQRFSWKFDAHSDKKWVIKLVDKHGDKAASVSAKKYFKKFDKNGDGVVSLNEI